MIMGKFYFIFEDWYYEKSMQKFKLEVLDFPFMYETERLLKMFL